MRERRDDRLDERDIEVAWAGWPIPEMIGGGLVGSVVVLSSVTVVPFLAVVPSVAGLLAGAVIGAALSWVWRPRRIELRRTRAATPEQQHIRARAA